MRPLVLDASAALAYLRGEPGAGQVERELGVREVILVPWLFWSEVVNVLARRHRWPGSQVLGAAYDLEQLGLHAASPSRQVMLAVIDAVEAHGMTAYDAEYLVLAETADADLLTADTFLAGVAGDRAIGIGPSHRLAELAPGYPQEPALPDPDWPRWPGAAAYLAELRREAALDLEALASAST